jgi:hypothetical protein
MHRQTQTQTQIQQHTETAGNSAKNGLRLDWLWLRYLMPLHGNTTHVGIELREAVEDVDRRVSEVSADLTVRSSVAC